MKQQRLPDLFALFFDPRIPILFIIGSIVLAVVGNGVYDLIVGFLGGTPRTLGYIIVGALLILLFVTLSFRALIRVLATRRPSPAFTLPTNLQANPCEGLVLFVSEGRQTSEQPAIQFHLKGGELKGCWLIVSPETRQKAADIEAWLRQQNTTVRTTLLPLNDAFKADLAYQVVKDALFQAERAGLAATVDITAGTKPMTAGAVLACLDRGVPMQYMRTTFVDGKPVVNAQPQAMKVDVL
jgi:hypothetical protein